MFSCTTVDNIKQRRFQVGIIVSTVATAEIDYSKRNAHLVLRNAPAPSPTIMLTGPSCSSRLSFNVRRYVCSYDRRHSQQRERQSMYLQFICLWFGSCSRTIRLRPDRPPRPSSDRRTLARGVYWFIRSSLDTRAMLALDMSKNGLHQSLRGLRQPAGLGLGRRNRRPEESTDPYNEIGKEMEEEKRRLVSSFSFDPTLGSERLVSGEHFVIRNMAFASQRSTCCRKRFRKRYRNSTLTDWMTDRLDRIPR